MQSKLGDPTPASAKKPETPTSGGAHASLQAHVRGTDFATGESALAPREGHAATKPVQLKTGPKPPTTAAAPAPTTAAAAKPDACKPAADDGKKAADGDKKADPLPALLVEFEDAYPGAATMIEKTPSAVKLVCDAEAAGVEFGGLNIEGNAKTEGNKVFVRAGVANAEAMSDLLFEIKNALQQGRLAEIRDSYPQMDEPDFAAAKKYAREIQVVEIESVLALGPVWLEAKKILAKGHDLDRYDEEFYLSDYEKFRTGAKSKTQLVDEMLERELHAKYGDEFKGPSGRKPTVEDLYISQFLGLYMKS